MSDKPMYKLKYPITVTRQVEGGEPVTETINELPYHKLRPKELSVADGIAGENAKTIALVAHMTGLTKKQVGEDMEVEDYMQLTQAVGGFIPGGRVTGGPV